jgi:raffinose/stachyose/melibiose transport system permease protein
VLGFNALKTSAELGRNPLGPPLSPDFSNFPKAWELGNFTVTMRNSAIITVGTVIGVCIIAGMAAYALSRLDLPGGNGVLFSLFVGSAVPFQLFLVPLFFLWSRLQLTNTLIGIIIIYWAIYSPFATLLLRSYLVALPRDFEDAARIDGANEFQVLTRVVLPLAWPGFLTVALVSGLAAWNEFFFAVTFIQDDNLKPIATSFLSFQSQFSRDWGLTSAAGLFMILPVIVLFLMLQRRFIEGLASGGLKG